MTKTVDIIIPVYNRHQVLSSALDALWKQILPPNWQPRVIICDDGSTRDIASISTPSNWRKAIVIKQKHAGIAAARNKAIESSDADIIFLLGADILLRPHCLAEHLSFHDKYPDSQKGAVGYVIWDHRLPPTPFMEWMTHGGPQNNFDDLLGEETADPRHHFYGSHLSLKRSIIQSVKFRDGYEPYGWEDLDMGHQLVKRGLQLFVLHDAVGLHRHSYKMEQILERQRNVGATVGQFITSNNIPAKNTLTLSRRFKVWIYRWSGLGHLVRLVVKTYGKNHTLPWGYQLITSGEFWTGVSKEKKA